MLAPLTERWGWAAFRHSWIQGLRWQARESTLSFPQGPPATLAPPNDEPHSPSAGRELIPQTFLDSSSTECPQIRPSPMASFRNPFLGLQPPPPFQGLTFNSLDVLSFPQPLSPSRGCFLFLSVSKTSGGVVSTLSPPTASIAPCRMEAMV